MSGLELQKELLARRIELPVIFISAYGEVPTATSALRSGAVDFLIKPFSPQLLIERIHEAIALDRRRATQRRSREEFETQLSGLTRRERQVMQHLARGQSTKQIALALDISVKTVDNHRTRVLEKMRVDNTAQLARLVSDLHGSDSGFPGAPDHESSEE